MFFMLAVFIKSLVDCIMTTCCFKKERSLYRKYKYINSDDFSDLKEGLDPVKRKRENQTKANENI